MLLLYISAITTVIIVTIIIRSITAVSADY